MRRIVNALALLLLALATPAFAEPIVGEPAPPVELEHLLQAGDGAAATLGALDGNVVVLEFWATWCAPCVAAIPHMNALAEAFADRPVRFISITDEDAATVEPFLDRRKMASWVGLDTDRSVFDAYGIQGIPATAVIGGDGRLLAMTYPTQLNAAHIEAALRGEAPAFPAARSETMRYSLGGDPEDPEDMPEFLFRITIRPTAAVDAGEGSSFIGRGSGPGSRTSIDATLRSLLADTYGVPGGQVIGHEGMLGQRATVAAKVPPEAADELDGLIRAALASTFAFNSHEEERPGDVVVLGPPSGDTGALQPTVMSEGGGAQMTAGTNSLKMVNRSLDDLARWLDHSAFPDRRVVNESGIVGSYDFEIAWPADQPRQEAILDALREQLGLAIRIEERPVRFIVVEPK